MTLTPSTSPAGGAHQGLLVAGRGAEGVPHEAFAGWLQDSDGCSLNRASIPLGNGWALQRRAPPPTRSLHRGRPQGKPTDTLRQRTPRRRRGCRARTRSGSTHNASARTPRHGQHVLRTGRPKRRHAGSTSPGCQRNPTQPGRAIAAGGCGKPGSSRPGPARARAGHTPTADLAVDGAECGSGDALHLRRG